MKHNGKKDNLNAVTHGILANRILPNENEDDYTRLSNDFFARFQPIDTVEAACVRTMVDCTWRQERILAQETAILQTVFDPSESVQFSVARELDSIVRYESMLRRKYDAAHKRLQELQANRPAPVEETPEVAPQSAPSPTSEPEPDRQPEMLQSNDLSFCTFPDATPPRPHLTDKRRAA